jgi:threonine/homoserine/homoserine lactone efflux protein
MVLTPGANMLYLVSRSICQGKIAGMISLIGVVCGFVFYMLAVTFGLTAIFTKAPYLYEVIKILGAIYLAWLAWKAITAKNVLLTAKELPKDSVLKLFSMGFLTNLLNPKVAVFYISLLPQFIKPEKGSVILQSLFFGFTQILISFVINTVIVLTAATIFNFFNSNPKWATYQKWTMGLVLWGLAIKLVFT